MTFTYTRITAGAIRSGLIALLVGCASPNADLEVDEQAAATAINGLNSLNGLVSANGLNSLNGLSSVNGLSSLNGLNSVNGLSSVTGLMTTAVGRITVGYVVKCALPAGHSLSKKDQNGQTYTFPGQFGMGPGWENGACDTTCQEAVSACIMAHVNVAGVIVPLWLDSPNPAIGFGRSTSYPNQEGTFFGNLFVAGPDGKVPAYYCEGPGFSKGIVPGRLGGPEPTPFRNPFGDGGTCAERCVAADAPSTGDGYKDCLGYKNSVTVWRASTYTPNFSQVYRYKLINSQTKLAVHVRNGAGTDGTVIEECGFSPSINHLFNILPVNGSWKLVSANPGNGKAWTNKPDGSIVQYSFQDDAAHDWFVADHNGHFKIANKGSNYAVQANPSNLGEGVGLNTDLYRGTANQDWDIIAVP